MNSDRDIGASKLSESENRVESPGILNSFATMEENQTTKRKNVSNTAKIAKFAYHDPKMSPHLFLENECILFCSYTAHEQNVLHPTFL